MKNLLNKGFQSVSETEMVMVEGGCPVCQYPDMPPPPPPPPPVSGGGGGGNSYSDR